MYITPKSSGFRPDFEGEGGMAGTETVKIFLSYAAEQFTLAERLYLSLVAGGHEVFFDRTNIPPGTDFNDIILSQIRHSDLLIYLISPQSIREGAYARTELKFAQEVWRAPLGHVLPVMVKATPIEDVPNYLKAVSILTPQGDPVAEVSAAVRDLVTGWKPEYMVLSQGRALEEARRVIGRMVAEQQLRSLNEAWLTKWRSLDSTRGIKISHPEALAACVIAFAAFLIWVAPAPIWAIFILACLSILIHIPSVNFELSRDVREYQRKRAEILRGDQSTVDDDEYVMQWLDSLSGDEDRL